MVYKSTTRSSRTEMLLGEAAMKRLAAARVAIFGVGGVGGYALEALVRTGVGQIDVIDADTVSESNLNRQIIATEATVGRSKVEVAAERCRSINPEVGVTTISTFYSPDTADAVDLTVYDYIIDAIDTVASKTELIARATALGVPIISSMGTGGKLDPTALEVTDIYKTSVCPLARAMRTALRRRGVKRLKVVYSKEEPTGVTVTDTVAGGTPHRVPGSAVFVPAAAGLTLASVVVRDLISDAGGGL